MRISVIIPYYNNESTISRTLDSLVVQIIPIYEVIIIDDCSKDENKLLEIISSYKLKLPIQLLRNNKNKNGAYSRNRGILVSEGEITAFLDADDTWAKNKTERIIELVDQYGVNNLFFSKVRVELNGKINYSRPDHFNSDIHISEYLFLEDGFIQTSSIFCSTLIAKKILFQEHFKRHQDYDFVLRAANEGVIFQFIPEELVTYSSEAKVNLTKGEAYGYSKMWANEMRIYFSESGFYGFQIFNLTARLIAEKRYIKAFINLLGGLKGLKMTHYKRIYPKLKRTLKNLSKN